MEVGVIQMKENNFEEMMLMAACNYSCEVTDVNWESNLWLRFSIGFVADEEEEEELSCHTHWEMVENYDLETGNIIVVRAVEESQNVEDIQERATQSAFAQSEI